MTKGSSDEADGQSDLWSVLPAGVEVATSDDNPQGPEHTRFPVAAPFDERASSALDMFVGRLLDAELALLPRRKQRLIEQMRVVVEHHARTAGRSGYDALALRWRSIGAATTVTAGVMHADLSDVADRWHDLIWPMYTEAFSNYRKARPFTLDLITKDLMAKPLSLDEVEAKFGGVPMVPPPEERISAGIVGVGPSVLTNGCGITVT